MKEFAVHRFGALMRLGQRYDALRRVLERRFALNRWFPHVPLGLSLVPLGLFLFYSSVVSILGWTDVAPKLDEVANRLIGARLHGLSELVVGGMLIVTAYGLILRARMAWWLAVLALATSLSLHFVWDESVVVSPWVLAYRASLLVWLLFNRAHFAAHSVPAQSALGIYVILMFLVCATVFTLRRGDHFHPEIHDLLTALYFVVMTVSTVGFGDIVPRDSETRGFVLGLILIGVLLIGSTISVFLIPLVTNRLRSILGHREDPVNRTRHFIIIGATPLARNAAVELEKRGQAVTLVLSTAVEDAFYQHRDVVVGDATDLEVLRTAGTEGARGVLALSGDDATNGFIVLGVNELNPSIMTVAALNDPKNRSRVERTQPSIVLSLQVLGGQLLAMALTGEAVHEDFLESVLKIQGVPAPASSATKA